MLNEIGDPFSFFHGDTFRFFCQLLPLGLVPFNHQESINRIHWTEKAFLFRQKAFIARAETIESPSGPGIESELIAISPFSGYLLV